MSEKPRSPTADDASISVLMNFHREGFLAQTTIASAKAAVAYFERSGLGKVSTIAVIDKGDEITSTVVQSNDDFISRIEHVAYGDLAQSRNHGVRLADGNHVAFLDGDDLWGESWLARAYIYAKQLTTPTVLHTEYFIAFGRENFARVQWDSDAPEFDALTLMQNWHFCNNSFASRELLLENPFVSYDHDSGFGSEDWHWSCETLARGIRHAPVPSTAYFYRMRTDTLAVGGDGHLGLGAKAGLLVRPSDLFMPSSPKFKRNASLIQDVLVLPHGEMTQQLKRPPANLPDSIWAEWEECGKIDADCYPTTHVRNTINIFRPDIYYALTRLYRKTIAEIAGCEDFIFLEYRHHKETLEAMNAALARIQRKTAIFILSDTQLHHDISDDKVVVIGLWKSAIEAGMGGNEIATLLTRLLLQLTPKRLTNLWSSFATDAVLIPYCRAFQTLGIEIESAVYADNTTDLFNERFQKEWTSAIAITGPRTRIVTANAAGAEFIARRMLSSDQDRVQSLFGDSPSRPKLEKRTDVPVSPPEISCILNVHREGELIKATLLSLLELIEHTCINHACQLELIIVFDRSDELTRKITEAALSDFPCRVVIKEVANSNLAISRNDGIAAASGKYVALLDADDLYARNWLIAALNSLANLDAPEKAVIHPQYNVYFGAEKRIFEHKPLHPNDPHAFGLAFTNYWTSLLFARRDLLLALPFDPIAFERGYAFEDWSWNLKALKHGIVHLIAPDTAHFIRLKRHGSLNAASVNAGAIYRPAGIFKESIE